MTGPTESDRDPAYDARPGGWVARRAPPWARPYLRLARIDRPIGAWLLMWPGLWSLALAGGGGGGRGSGGGWPEPWLLAAFVIGAVVMRAAGCTFNDIIDRDFDAQVARTRSRPLPSGEVTVAQAAVLMAALAAIGLAILLSFNAFAVWVGLASGALIVVYPFMKRVTHWPQFVLGLAFNWGALLGWAAARGTLDWPPLALYAAGIAWTLGYDTIYAHQDKSDDAVIGVKSTALRLGAATRPFLWAFYAATAAGAALGGALEGLAWPFYAGLAAAAAHLAWQAARVDLDSPRDCLAKFRANRDFGALLFLAFLAGRVLG